MNDRERIVYRIPTGPNAAERMKMLILFEQQTRRVARAVAYLTWAKTSPFARSIASRVIL